MPRKCERSVALAEGPVPFGVPQVISWPSGSRMGIALWMAIREVRRPVWYWIGAIVLGAILPSIVARVIVVPLKGQTTAFECFLGAYTVSIERCLGFGTALLMRLFVARR